ncbi:hybrid sensor histidine kinase/response regulator [Salinibius halmophilus]|uniref:hybrid sensor histidine kinase/response regulator n=1 Tax=Salinibius halmophilus TaxID=1853216 RepID=UPI000E67007C|nr:hybrid sensor histidine kinase/response regulator [Salinibius halmophilus]
METWQQRTWAASILLLLLASTGFAQALTIPVTAQDQYPLEPYVEWYLEPGDSKLTEAQVLNLPNDAWQSRAGTFNEGVRAGVVWAKFQLDLTDTYHRDWSLHVETPHLSKIDIFELKDGKPISLYRSGLDRAFESREFSHHDYILKISPIDQTEFLLRLEHDEWLRIPITLKKTNHLEEELRVQLLLDGLTYGLMLGLIVLTLLMLVAGRDTVHLYFLGYIISATIYVAGLDGYFMEYFWPKWVPWFGPVLHMFTLAILACGALFFTRALQVKQWAPKLAFGLNTMAVVFISLLPVVIFAPGHIMNLVEIYLTLPLAALTVAAASKAIKRGDKSATILIIGLVIQWLSIGVYVQETLGTIDIRNHGVDIIKVGTVVGSTIMALALAYRIRLIAEARRMAEVESQNRAKYMTQVSHEIRAPMSGILGITDLLELANSEAERQQHIQAIRQAGDDLLVLVNDLLDEARLKAGKLSLRNKDFDLRRCLDQVVQLCKGGHRNPDVELRLAVADNIPSRVVGDHRRIAQVLINLVSNAAKFTHTGSITIETKVSQLNDGSQGIRFSVIDTGIGIDKSSQAQLFEAFSQANEQIEATYGGFGLGLSICRELVNEMGGKLELVSEIGKGASFSFTLPLPMVVEDFSGTPTSTPDHASIRALAAEDNEVNRKVLENFMRYEGHDIMSFANAEQLIACWSETADIQVIFLDINLPEMDGPTAARQIINIAKEQQRPEPVIIGISGNVGAEDESRCIEAGMQQLLHKPLRLNRLQQVLDQFNR